MWQIMRRNERVHFIFFVSFGWIETKVTYNISGWHFMANHLQLNCKQMRVLISRVVASPPTATHSHVRWRFSCSCQSTECDSDFSSFVHVRASSERQQMAIKFFSPLYHKTKLLSQVSASRFRVQILFLFAEFLSLSLSVAFAAACPLPVWRCLFYFYPFYFRNTQLTTIGC